MSKSPDGTGKAVFLAAEADGSIVQVHVLKGVDGLAPAGTFHPLPNADGRGDAVDVAATPSRASGWLFNWVPTRIAYVSDPLADRIVALDIGDDGTLFTAGAPRVIRSRWFRPPGRSGAGRAGGLERELREQHDARRRLRPLRPQPRQQHRSSASTQAGQVLAVRRIEAALPPFRVNGIAVSEDAQTIWVTVVMAGGRGAVLQLPSFGAGFITPTMVDHAPRAGRDQLVGDGRRHVRHRPLAAAGAWDRCSTGAPAATATTTPIVGGMGATPDSFVTRVGRIDGGMFDPLIGEGGPVARAHSIAEPRLPLRPADRRAAARRTSRPSAAP